MGNEEATITAFLWVCPATCVIGVLVTAMMTAWALWCNCRTEKQHHE